MVKDSNNSKGWHVMMDQRCALWFDQDEVDVWELTELFWSQTLSTSKFEEFDLN
jgi:hypothetical protein